MSVPRAPDASGASAPRPDRPDSWLPPVAGPGATGGRAFEDALGTGAGEERRQRQRATFARVVKRRERGGKGAGQGGGAGDEDADGAGAGTDEEPEPTLLEQRPPPPQLRREALERRIPPPAEEIVPPWIVDRIAAPLRERALACGYGEVRVDLRSVGAAAPGLTLCVLAEPGCVRARFFVGSTGGERILKVRKPDLERLFETRGLPLSELTNLRAAG